ncbi:hypothetical protein ACRRTK_014432 [Alexandromys fortis]
MKREEQRVKNKKLLQIGIPSEAKHKAGSHGCRSWSSACSDNVGDMIANTKQSAPYYRPKGKITFCMGIRVAPLALKHGQGKNHEIHVIAFVSYPMEYKEK